MWTLDEPQGPQSSRACAVPQAGGSPGSAFAWGTRGAAGIGNNLKVNRYGSSGAEVTSNLIWGAIIISRKKAVSEFLFHYQGDAGELCSQCGVFTISVGAVGATCVCR